MMPRQPNTCPPIQVSKSPLVGLKEATLSAIKKLGNKQSCMMRGSVS